MTFSIIIPVYNVAHYLRECLNSVLKEQGDGYEVIAINDCSPDGSLDILREYEKKHSNLKIVDFERNQGVSAARNAGLEVARGEWILFCDSDDVFVPGALPFLQKKIRESDCDIVTFELTRVKSASESVPCRMEFDDVVHDMSDHEDAAAFVCKNFPYRLWAWNKCFKRELIGDLRFRNFQPCEDAIWVLECMCRAKKILELPNVLYKYLQHEGSCLATVSYKRIYGDIQGMRGLCEVMLSSSFFHRISTCAYQGLRNAFLMRIPYDIAKLENKTERIDLANHFFHAAKYVFEESYCGSLMSRVFYKMLLCCHSLTVVKMAFVCRHCLRNVLCRFKRAKNR